MINAIDKGTAQIICVEAAGLMEYSAEVLGSGGVSSRGVNWEESGVINGVTKTWRSGHAYCLYNGKVHDPVPSNAGPRNKSEDKYIDENLKTKENTSNFTSPGDRSFSFKE